MQTGTVDHELVEAGLVKEMALSLHVSSQSTEQVLVQSVEFLARELDWNLKHIFVFGEVLNFFERIDDVFSHLLVGLTDASADLNQVLTKRKTDFLEAEPESLVDSKENAVDDDLLFGRGLNL